MEKYKKVEIDFENKIAKDYNHWYHSSLISQKYDQDFVKYVKKNIKKADKILDLGCGSASLWQYLTRINDIDLTGADVSPQMIKEAKKLYPKGKFFVADSEKLPFKNEEFDAVILSSVLHHLPSPVKTFEEVRRVLKPYGKLIGREPQDDQFIKEADPWIGGAITSLMHFIIRKEKTTVHKEPEIHSFHGSYKLAEFVKTNLGKYFIVSDIKSKYPLSSLFTKIKKAFYGELLLATDRFLDNYKGNQFFYLAIKDGYGKTEVLSYVNTYLKKLEENSKNKKIPLKFIRRLILITAIIDLILPRK